MIPFSIVLQHSLLYGMILSIFMSSIIFVTFYWCPLIWLSDAPDDIQQAMGPLSKRDQRIRGLVGIPTLMVVVGILVYSIIQLATLAQGVVSFGTIALSIFLIIQVFNLVDLIIIDWLILVLIRPSFLTVPGTEQFHGPQAYLFHFYAFLKGSIGALIASLVIAAISSAVLLIYSAVQTY